MRKAILGLVVPLALLAGCEMKVVTDETNASDTASLKVGEDGNVSITANDGAKGVSVSVPGFEGKMKIPGLDLGGDHIDIDGMKLYPGSQVKGINVTDRKGPGHSLVEIGYTSPAGPETVSAYYADAARERDFTDIKLATKDGVETFTARKPDGDEVTITMTPAAGKTTAGRITIRGAQ